MDKINNNILILLIYLLLKKNKQKNNKIDFKINKTTNFLDNLNLYQME